MPVFKKAVKGLSHWTNFPWSFSQTTMSASLVLMRFLLFLLLVMLSNAAVPLWNLPWLWKIVDTLEDYRKMRTAPAEFEVWPKIHGKFAPLVCHEHRKSYPRGLFWRGAKGRVTSFCSRSKPLSMLISFDYAARRGGSHRVIFTTPPHNHTTPTHTERESFPW